MNRAAIANPICPYCSRPAVFTPNSTSVYHGHDYGPLWLCNPCQAWVGCHADTTPLGRLANKELRRLKVRAHTAFDVLWKSGHMSRGGAYAWLADRMEVTKDQCHIGLFNEAQCLLVETVCRQWVAGRIRLPVSGPRAADRAG